MADKGRLAPNKLQTSDQAKAVWKWFADNNFSKSPVNTFHDEEYLNFAYRLPNILKNKAQNVLRQGQENNNAYLSSFGKYEKDEYGTLILEAADAMLSEKMSEIY